MALLPRSLLPGPLCSLQILPQRSSPRDYLSSPPMQRLPACSWQHFPYICPAPGVTWRSGPGAPFRVSCKSLLAYGSPLPTSRERGGAQLRGHGSEMPAPPFRQPLPRSARRTTPLLSGGIATLTNTSQDADLTARVSHGASIETVRREQAHAVLSPLTLS